MAERHAHCIEYDAAIDTPAHRPTDDASRVKIHDHRQVQPTLAGPDISDVGRPALVHCRCREVLIKQVARRGTATPGRDPIAPLRTALEARFVH